MVATASAAPLYTTSIDSVKCYWFAQNVVEGCNLDIKVKVVNTGNEACTECKVEAGIYKIGDINSWYAPRVVLASGTGVTDIPNCVTSEANVDNAKVALQPGESTLVTFTVKAPYVNQPTGVADTSYAVHTQAYGQCWSPGVDIRQMSFAVQKVPVYEAARADPQPSCSDSQTNGGESDIDCGGQDCAKCGLERRCQANTDCQTGYCAYVPTQLLYRCAVVPPDPPPPPVPGNCGNGKVDTGEDCQVCRQDMPAGQCVPPIPCDPAKEDCGGQKWYEDPVIVIALIVGLFAFFTVGRKVLKL